MSKNSDPDRVSVKVLKGGAKFFHYRYQNYLRADVCKYRELVDKRKISDFFIFCLNNLFGELLLKITIKLSKGISFCG